MKFLVAGAALCAACGASSSPSTPQILELKRWSPPQASAHDLLLAARGDVVVLANRLSRDAGATWTALPAGIGELKGVAIVGQQLTLFGTTSKLARGSLASGTVVPIAGTPAFTTERTWRVDPAGNAIAFDAIENTIATEHSGVWTTASLPRPAPTELRPYVKDVESNGTTLLSVSAWGVHRSTDGVTWTLAASASDPRDIVVLADGRFVVVNSGPALLFDATGTAAGTLPGLSIAANEATVCEDGAIVAQNQVTLDLGATWHSLIVSGDLDVQVQHAGCGGGRYWVLSLSDVWGYRFVRFDALDAPGIVAGNWDVTGAQAWTNGGPPIVRANDGTFLVAGLALTPGATEWTLRETPGRTWASGDTLFGVQKGEFYTSGGGGTSWVASLSTGLTVEEPEAFARTPDGTLYVSQFTGSTATDGVDMWRSIVWRSTDAGASWSVAYDGIATRGTDDVVTGEAHRFVGIAPDGAWIATDAISHDGGMTWQTTDVKGDRGLAHLTQNGTLVTGGADERLWRVYDDGGLGALRATYQLEVEGNPIPASQLRSVAFDVEGYAYTARGNPYVQIWRSDRPLE